jgi:DNA-binding protein
MDDNMEPTEEMGGQHGAPMPSEPRQMRRDDNTVYVGKKGTMGYVLAVVTQFNNGASEVTVKARGKLISRAVDVVEIVRHRFMPSAKVQDIAIATEELTSEDGSKTKVSSIEIKIQK